MGRVGSKGWFVNALLVGLTVSPSAAHAQLITTVVDRDGVGFACVTVGPLAPIAQDYCVRRTLAQGALLKRDLGVSGLTLDDEGSPPSARVAAVAPGSPASAAGVQPGDVLTAVDGRAVRRTPADVARQLLFGPRGAPVRLTLLRAGAPVDVVLTRTAEPEPDGAPHSPNILVGVHPVMNWRGEFVPCMGVGVLGPAAVAACLAKYKHAGFVQTDDLGATGLTLVDAARPDGTAAVAAVEPGSAAAVAGVRAGDEIQAVDAKPLTASSAHAAEVLLFGKAGGTRQLTLQRNGRTYVVDLTLAGRS